MELYLAVTGVTKWILFSIFKYYYKFVVKFDYIYFWI